jgi:protein-S-isoprenylcysteine O-methyltransferase Ste14
MANPVDDPSGGPDRRSPFRNVASILAFLFAVAALAFLVLRRHLFATHPILIGVQVGAVLLMLWARRTFGLRSFHAAAEATEGGLVTTGPYRLWRHPIYASIVYFTWAGQVESPDLHAVASAGVVTLALLVRMILEERSLCAAYPEYREYARRAKRFIPFVL